MADREILALQDKVHALEPFFDAVSEDCGGNFNMEEYLTSSGIQRYLAEIQEEPEIYAVELGDTDWKFMPVSISVEDGDNERNVRSVWKACDPSLEMQILTASVCVRNGELDTKSSGVHIQGRSASGPAEKDSLHNAVVLTEWMRERMYGTGALEDPFDGPDYTWYVQ